MKWLDFIVNGTTKTCPANDNGKPVCGYEKPPKTSGGSPVPCVRPVKEPCTPCSFHKDE